MPKVLSSRGRKPGCAGARPAAAVLDDAGLSWEEGPGEAAFYGPKIDVQVADSAEREATLSTVQVDFYQPERFGLQYTGPDGGRHRPVVVHRSVAGSMERAVAHLLERHDGAFPDWLAPEQVVVLPVTSAHGPAAAEAARQAAGRLRPAPVLRTVTYPACSSVETCLDSAESLSSMLSRTKVKSAHSVAASRARMDSRVGACPPRTHERSRPGRASGSGVAANRDDVKVSRLHAGHLHIVPAEGRPSRDQAGTPEARVMPGTPDTVPENAYRSRGTLTGQEGRLPVKRDAYRSRATPL